MRECLWRIVPLTENHAYQLCTDCYNMTPDAKNKKLPKCQVEM